MTHLVTRDPFAPFSRRRATAPGGMPVNVYETETGIAIDATLPGFDKDDIEVTFEAGRLKIRAEHNVGALRGRRPRSRGSPLPLPRGVSSSGGTQLRPG